MNSPVSVSVALCTYNGAAYLAEQLQSIARQSLLPTEVVISDDGSTDGTATVVQAFAREAPFPIRWVPQPVNLGVVQNFAAALTLCRSDVIALCDQDDVWLPNKLQICTEFLRSNLDCWAVFTNAVVVDEQLQPYPDRPLLWQHVGLTPEIQLRVSTPATSLQPFISAPYVTGATVVLRRELLRYALPIPTSLPARMIHDGWLAVVAASLGRLASLDQPTILYRQHGGQQAGLIPEVPLPQSLLLPHKAFGQAAEYSSKLYEALSCRVLGQATPGVLEEVRFRANHFRLRADLPASRCQRVGPVIREWKLGGYRRFCRRPLLAAMRDILL